MSSDILSKLESALLAHGLSTTRHPDFLSVDDGRLQLEAEVIERDSPAGNVTVTLEVRAYAEALNRKPIVECFAGIGDSKDLAISDAFGKMLLGSFHVLIEALTSHTCTEEQAEIEHWARNDAAWNAFSGPLLTQHSGSSTLSTTYPALISKLTSLFEGTVAPGPHWVRVFLASYHGQIQASEVLLDNEPWEQGHSLLISQDWSCTDDYQSIRHFVLALPTQGREG